MSGDKFLLDTNILLGVLQQSESAMQQVKSLLFDECGFSTVTLMEFLENKLSP